MKKRVVFRATGEVQKVGYRDFVQKVARKLGVVGKVENMRDGSIQIVCEGEELTIEAFKKTITVKANFIDVTELNVVETGKATGEFEYFDIKRGEMTEELGERLDIALLHLDNTKDELKNEIKDGFKDTKEGLTRVETAVGSMHIDMNTRFDTLDTKYGEINKKMNDLTAELHRSTDALVAMTEKVGALIDKKLAE